MNQQQRLFLVQARSDYRMFHALRKDGAAPCHAIHYLQMSTEKLAKAYLWGKGHPGMGHAAFRRFCLAMIANDRARMALDQDGRRAWEMRLNAIVPLAYDVERLAPDLAGAGPNPEYPWPPRRPIATPVEFAFPLFDELQRPRGKRLLHLLDRLFACAEQYL